ncbi:hypothetical protein CEXT_91871 [Caerostris extrusa]|uniref:Uncharacterized protein n=1 Tax=Caerostris extrusa TaxID=172846 RepID=A0AAV4M352_CAEEX|nr:hypothetical protein CEXT_91871 [Caerostris extrusa]
MDGRGYYSRGLSSVGVEVEGGGPLVRGHRPGAGGDGLRLRQVDAQLFSQLGVVLLVDVVEHAAARHLHLRRESLGYGSEMQQWTTPSPTL